MKIIFVFGFLIIAILGCSKPDSSKNLYLAKIVGYDLNCSTCILSFPDDSLAVRNLLGVSPNNYYQGVNLNKNDFKIGQLITVQVRKALDTELPACITLYPSSNYKTIYVTGFNNYRDFSFNDTIDLAYKNCLTDFEGHTTFCFDSVVTDSRCPVHVLCIWAGEAIVRFKITSDNNTKYLNLYTHTNDADVNGYKLSLIDLLPYPTAGQRTKPEDYKARIIIRHK